jgi:GxxExxY protein
MLESVYQACLVHELRKRSFRTATQLPLPVNYDGERIDLGFRIDILVENTVIVEIKAVDAIHPVHLAQVITYLKLSGKYVGLLINFNVVHLRDGIRRMVQGEPPRIPSVSSASSVVKSLVST